MGNTGPARRSIRR